MLLNLGWAFFGTIGFAVYVLPSAIGVLRKKIDLPELGAVNLLLGWTLAGWVVALVWSLSNDPITPDQ